MALAPHLHDTVCSARRRLAHALIIFCLCLPTVGLLNAAFTYLDGNFHVVHPGLLYRSGQLDPETLASVISDNRIKTVINLRGAHPGKSWYDDEIRVTSQLNAQHVDLQISAKRVPDLKTVQQLDLLLRTLPKPILVHCYGGADRSGLVSALFEANILNEPHGVAARQLSFYYGHFPWLWSQSGAMDSAFEKYARIRNDLVIANR